MAFVAATIVVTVCQGASKKYPVSCDSARQTVLPWLEARGFRVVEGHSLQTGDVALRAKRPRNAEGNRLWNLARYVRTGGQTLHSSSCFKTFDVVGVSAKLRFQTVAEGCSVALVHRYLGHLGDSCGPGASELFSEARSNSKLEGSYLSTLNRVLGEVPGPKGPTPLRDRRPANRERGLLFVPDPRTPRPLPRLQASDVEANLAGKPLDVIDVAGRERVSQTPVVVVLDFANTRMSNHACLAAEIAPVIEKVGKDATFQVLLTAGTMSPFFSADFGIRDLRPMFLFSYSSPSDAAQKCVEGYLQNFGWPGLMRAYFGDESRKLLSDLGLALSGRSGPTRLFWISDSFGWVDTELAITKETDPHAEGEQAFENIPDTVASVVENLSEAGVTIFPVLLPQRSARLADLQTSGVERRAAKSLADLTGGFVTVAEANPGVTLRRLLEASEDGYVFRLRAPITGRRFWDGRAHTLNVIDRAANLSLHRAVTVAEEGAVETRDEALDKYDRLVAPSADLQLVAGCPGSRGTSSVAIHLPAEVTAAPASTVHVLVSFRPRGDQKGLKQRLTLPRPQTDSSSGEVRPLCFELERTEAGTKFSLVVFDEGTNWAGALNGEIAK